jgi:hypothetical protein
VESWASLVDKSALEGLPDRERRRQEVCFFVLAPCISVRQSLIHVAGKAIFELIATEGAYVRDLQLVVEVCEHFVHVVDNLMEPYDVPCFVDILLEHVKDLGTQDDFHNICECRGYLVDEYDVPELARGAAAQL